jgi:hypothetical protein
LDNETGNTGEVEGLSNVAMETDGERDLEGQANELRNTDFGRLRERFRAITNEDLEKRTG